MNKIVIRSIISIILMCILGCNDGPEVSNTKTISLVHRAEESNTTTIPGNEVSPSSEVQDPLLVKIAKEGDLNAFDEQVAKGIDLKENGIGILALEAAQSPAMKKRIVEEIYKSFNEPRDLYRWVFHRSDPLVRAYREDNRYKPFINQYINFWRQEDSDAEILRDSAYNWELFEILASTGIDLNQFVSKVYGLRLERDSGPLIVSATAIGDQFGDVILKIMRSLVVAGANVNAVDNLNHSVRYYAERIFKNVVNDANLRGKPADKTLFQYVGLAIHKGGYKNEKVIAWYEIIKFLDSVDAVAI